MAPRFLKKRVRPYKRFVTRRYGGTALSKFNFKKLAADVAQVKSVINSELKYHEVAQNAALPIAGTALVQELNAMALGDYAYNRHGASVKIKSLQGRVDLKQSSSTAYTQGERVRMVIFIDKEPLVSGLGVNPTYTDLYTSGGVRSLRSWESIQQKRFTVLMDRTFTFEPEKASRTFNIYKRLNMVTKFNSTTSAADAITNNALYVMFMGENGSTTIAERVTLDASWRVTFRDN